MYGCIVLIMAHIIIMQILAAYIRHNIYNYAYAYMKLYS